MVSLLEVHKLMYFMQESGERLRLKYSKAPYGPYADNLRHVLNAIEGHLISGYEDGGDAPDKQIELLPGAIEDAKEFLQQQHTTQEHFKKVISLVDGFETPFGLELLVTVHWVSKYEHANNIESAVEKIHNWNHRKKQFSKRQIAVAYNHLVEGEWIEGNE